MPRRTFIIAALITSVGCTDNDLEDGATAIARLSVTNAAALTQALFADEGCGFANDAVLDACVVVGDPGEAGVVTYAIAGCTLDFDASPVSEEDCEGVTTTLSGAVTVTATLTIAGTVTGDADQPVLPKDALSTTLTVSSAILDRYRVDVEGLGAAFELTEGTLSFVARPRFAVSNETGFCTAPTGDLQLDDVVLSNVNGQIFADDEADAYAFVRRSSVDAVLGKVGEAENTYAGLVDLAFGPIDVPVSGEEALDPDYDRASFEAAVACEADLKMPIDDVCDGSSATGRDLALGVARLSVTGLAAIAELVADDETCGFASPAAIGGTQLSDEPGALGTATSRIVACAIDVESTTVLEDCAGAGASVRGRVVVTAEQVATGLLTGTATAPIAPITDRPATITFESIELDGFFVRAGTATGAATLGLLSGSLAGVVAPRFAKSASSPFCAVDTPNVAFDGVRLADARVTVQTTDGTAAASVAASALQATSGDVGADENALTGTIVVDGAEYTFADPLDPDYDATAFANGYACFDDLETPVSFMCDAIPEITLGAARLTPSAFASVVQMIEADEVCGFASAGTTVQLDGAVGSEGTATFTLAGPCTIDFPFGALLARDCQSVETYVAGSVTVAGTRAITGFLTGSAAQPVVPTSGDATTYDLDVDFEDFTVQTTGELPAFTVASGSIAGEVTVRAALDTTTGACTLPTPRARFEGLAYSNAELRVTDEGVTLGVTVTSGNLSAESGRPNRIAGTLRVDGGDVVIDDDLDPDFDAATFDASFTCTPNLVVPADDAQCSFRAALAPAIAALTIQNLATATQLVLQDTTCGFSSPMITPLAAVPPPPLGPPPQFGFVTNGITGCAIDPPDGAPLAEDCLRNVTVSTGRFTVTATQTVAGVRGEICNGPCLQIAIPVERTGLGVTASTLVPAGYSTAVLRAGETAATQSLALNGGRIGFEVTPLLGENAQMPGVFDVATPLARFTRVRLNGVGASVMLEGLRFDVTVDASDFAARVGRYEGVGNDLVGTIMIDDQPIPLAGPLDPAYQQARFDLSYDCAPNLVGTIPPK
ncbi:MAG: hypothetical protein RMA76_11780 [Deltaproteobacteria bacterium]|jgi:hypothetical protein